MKLRTIHQIINSAKKSLIKIKPYALFHNSALTQNELFNSKIADLDKNLLGAKEKKALKIAKDLTNAISIRNILEIKIDVFQESRASKKLFTNIYTEIGILLKNQPKFY
jgi:hypothetical protein